MSGNLPSRMGVREVGTLLNESAQVDAVGHGRPVEGIPVIHDGEDVKQMVFYGVPWLNWNDRQAVLFDLEARRFFLFNLVLYPQDFVYLAVLLVLCALGLFLVTAVQADCGG